MDGSKTWDMRVRIKPMEEGTWANRSGTCYFIEHYWSCPNTISSVENCQLERFSSAHKHEIFPGPTNFGFKSLASETEG